MSKTSVEYTTRELTLYDQFVIRAGRLIMRPCSRQQHVLFSNTDAVPSSIELFIHWRAFKTYMVLMTSTDTGLLKAIDFRSILFVKFSTSLSEQQALRNASPTVVRARPLQPHTSTKTRPSCVNYVNRHNSVRSRINSYSNERNVYSLLKFRPPLPLYSRSMENAKKNELARQKIADMCKICMLNDRAS